MARAAPNAETKLSSDECPPEFDTEAPLSNFDMGSSAEPKSAVPPDRNILRLTRRIDALIALSFGQAPFKETRPPDQISPTFNQRACRLTMSSRETSKFDLPARSGRRGRRCTAD